MFVLRRAFFAALLLAVTTEPAAAWMMDVYNLDSLAWMATDIVEAEVVRLNEKHGEPAEVRVAAVHRGSRTAGDTIEVFSLRAYAKPGAKFGGTAPLAPGDRLFLFLKPLRRDGHGTSDLATEHPDALAVVSSGARLLHEGAAVSFRQYSNFGPFVAVDPVRTPEMPVTTVEEFRNRTAKAIETAADLKGRLEELSSPEDVPALLELLRERIDRSDDVPVPPPFFAGRDIPAEEACKRLANLHALDALDEAAFLKLPSWECRSAIERGFSFPEGREFLLAKVGDEEEPVERRLRYAEILRRAGREYDTTATKIRTNEASIDRGEQTDNAAYITRLARIAADIKDEKLRRELLDTLVAFAEGLPGRPEDDPIRADLRDAVPHLVALHRRTDSERVMFDVERFVSLVSRTDYRQFGSKCGPVLSVLEPADETDSRRKPAGRRLAYTYSVRFVEERNPPVEPVLTIVHQKTGRRWTGTPRRYRSGTHEAEGRDVVSLPDDLPKGTYRLFYRFVRDGRVVSEGYGFETEL